MKAIEIKIKGVSPLLMHAYPVEIREGLDKAPPAEQAEFHTYRLPAENGALGPLYVPGVNVQRGLVAAAAYSKGKGRASLQKVAAAAMFVEEGALVLEPQRYTIDSRSVVIPATKGRIMRHRACFPAWELGLTLSYDETLLTEGQVRRIVDDLGQRVGLLDFRPERKGSFGRFIVTAWES